jgi:hypothetical protein
MNNRLDSLLFAFILLSLAVVQGIDHFAVESSLTQFITGPLVGLTIVGGIVYVYRISVQSGQRR